MFYSALYIAIGIIFIAGVGRLIWQIARGSDAQRRKALATLLIFRQRVAAGDSPSITARERRAAKHAAWSQHQHQHTHSQAHHAASHHGSFSSNHSAHSSGHHSSSHHGSFDGSGHSGGHH